MAHDYQFNVKDVPGNVVRLSVYKPQRGPAVAVAQEGRAKVTSGGFHSFECELFGKDRSVRVPLNGNNTKKNRDAALLALLSALKESGMVDEAATL